MNENQPNIIFIPYWYVVVSPTLTANGAGQTPLLLDQDADFELHYIIGSYSTDVAASVRSNGFSVQITDKSNSRIWSSARVPQSHLSTNNDPYRLVRPVVLARRSNLNFDFLDLGVLTPGVATVSLHGAKVVYPGR